jgi:hypothetical protein
MQREMRLNDVSMDDTAAGIEPSSRQQEKFRWE